MRKLALFLLPFGLASAQHHMPPPPAEKPVVLYKGLGIWHHPIATTSPEAQKFFDQGLALLYGFNRYEAQRSFRKATELDPNAAMAWWGLGMSFAPYINMDGDPTYDQKQSCAAVEQGLKLAAAPEREKTWLRAAASRCPDDRPQAYIDAMKALADRWPDDLDAATFYAESLMLPPRWHWYAADGTPAPGVAEAEHVLERVMRRWPDHPGANHLYIHAVESSHTPERAVASAQRLMGVMPEAGHMVHMPAHIWLVLGDWDLAAGVNERAAQVDRDYFAETNVTGPYLIYYVHNLHFVAYARWMQGRKGDGLKAADDIAAAVAPIEESIPEMADAFLTMPIFGRVRFGDWDGILNMPQPKDTMRSTTLVWRFGRALAFAARGDRAAAEREQQAFEARRKALPADASWVNNKASDIMMLASEIISARLAAAPVEAVPHWRRAVAIQDALVYDEPPGWFYPVRESLGAALIRAGKPAEAETVLRDGVNRSPRNGRMLFGLMESLRAQGKTEDAEFVRREFDAAWRKADVKLSIEEM